MVCFSVTLRGTHKASGMHYEVKISGKLRILPKLALNTLIWGKEKKKKKKEKGEDEETWWLGRQRSNI